MMLYEYMGIGNFWLESFDFLFLGCIQLIVFFLFKKFPPKEKHIHRFGKTQFKDSVLSKPQLIIFYLGMLVCCWYLNERFQVFCNLEFYANVLLWICVSAILMDAYFEIKNKTLRVLLLFFQGVGVVIFLYLVIFWTSVFVSGIFFVIFGLSPFWIIALLYIVILDKNVHSRLALFTVLFSIFLPFLLLFQIKENFFKSHIFIGASLVLGFIFTLISANIALNQYQTFLHEMHQMGRKKFVELNPNNLSELDQYFLERTTGAHLKYHIRAGLFDGWRPPIHDPLFVFCWRTGGELKYVGYYMKIGLYKKLFPNLPIRMNCACGKPGSEIYFNDKRLE